MASYIYHFRNNNCELKILKSDRIQVGLFRVATSISSRLRVVPGILGNRLRTTLVQERNLTLLTTTAQMHEGTLNVRGAQLARMLQEHPPHVIEVKRGHEIALEQIQQHLSNHLEKMMKILRYACA